MNRFYGASCIALLAICSAVSDAASDKRPPRWPGIMFSVSDDQPLTYPGGVLYLPDEHTSFLSAGRAESSSSMRARGPLNFFVSMSDVVSGVHHAGTFVLQSDDLKHLGFAPGFGDAEHGHAVFWPAHAGSHNCDYRTVTHFDEQYAGAGSVLQDPTLPPGNLIMIYEAEIHCPPAPKGMAAGFTSIGVTRSSDGGRTWPEPIAQPGFEGDWLEYGNGRYAAITVPGTPPRGSLDRGYGDILPSAFIDAMDPSGNDYIYVPYQFAGAPDGTNGDGKLHIARAWIGDRSGRRAQGQLHFYKWFRGGWNGEGRGGREDGMVPSCGPSTHQSTAQIAYSDSLRRYLMTFVCTKYVCTSVGTCQAPDLSLFYTTATSLSAQDWTVPSRIENSNYVYQPDPKGGWIIDGGYPSFVSPGCKQGHLGSSGEVFLLRGNPLGSRQFVARRFEITSAGGHKEGERTSASACDREPAGDGK